MRLNKTDTRANLAMQAIEEHELREKRALSYLLRQVSDGRVVKYPYAYSFTFMTYLASTAALVKDAVVQLGGWTFDEFTAHGAFDGRRVYFVESNVPKLLDRLEDIEKAGEIPMYTTEV